MIGILSSDIEKSWGSISNAIINGNGKADFLKWWNLSDIKDKLKNKHWQCWTTGDAYFLTCITRYPTGYREFEILLVVGKGMDMWNEQAWSTLKQFARHNRCHEIKFMGRKGWLKYGCKYEKGITPEYRYRVKL